MLRFIHEKDSFSCQQCSSNLLVRSLNIGLTYFSGFNCTVDPSSNLVPYMHKRVILKGLNIPDLVVVA